MEEKISYIGGWIRDTFGIFMNELRMVVHDNGVMLIFLFAGLVYPVLYNWIYGYGVVDEMPVAVIDNSQGSYSRRYIREVDATREVAVAFDCVSMEEARRLMEEQQVHGIIYIPADFDTRLNRMEQATVSTYADMSTFLFYKNMTIRCQNLELGSNSFDYELARRNGQIPAEAAPAVQPAPVQAVPVAQAPVAQQAPQTAEVKVESEQLDPSEYTPALLEMARQLLAKSKKAPAQAPVAPSIETAPKADLQQAVLDDNDIPFDM